MLPGPSRFLIRIRSLWFTPSSWNFLNGGDYDFGIERPALITRIGWAAPRPHLMVGGGEGGGFFTWWTAILWAVLKRTRPVCAGDPSIKWTHVVRDAGLLQRESLLCSRRRPPDAKSGGFDPSTGNYVAPTPITSANSYNGGKGSGVYITANGTSNGIVWILNGNGLDGYNAANVSGPPIVTAQATIPPGNIQTQNTKFSMPIAANGKVYFTAYATGTNTGYLFVEGLLGAAVIPPAAPGNLQASAANSGSVVLTWADDSDNESGFYILRSTSASGPFTHADRTGGRQYYPVHRYRTESADNLLLRD